MRVHGINDIIIEDIETEVANYFNADGLATIDTLHVYVHVIFKMR